MTPLSPGLRRIAIEHFTNRLTALRKAAREGGDWAGDPANENANLWLAIVLAAGAGADLPQDVRDRIKINCIFPRGATRLPGPDQIAKPHAYLGELARARDVAVQKAESQPEDLRADQRARDLEALAKALGAPPINWRKPATSEERNAA